MKSVLDFARETEASVVVPALARNPEVTYTNCSGVVNIILAHRVTDGDKPHLDLLTPEPETSTLPRAAGPGNSGPVTRPLRLQLT